MKIRRALLLSITLVLVLCAACGFWLHKERQQYAVNRQLIDALKHNDTETALALVYAGADPNTRYDLPSVPSLKLLLASLFHHAPPSANNSSTAFMLACGVPLYSAHLINRLSLIGFIWKENLPLLRAMLAHGAKVNDRVFDTTTPLHNAVWIGRWHTTDLLLQHGADPNAQDSHGETPLMWVARMGTIDMLRLLLSHGANPNEQDASAKTVLFYAVSSLNAKNVIPELLAHGADPNLRNKRGDTPLQFAQQMNRPNLVRLLKHGAK